MYLKIILTVLILISIAILVSLMFWGLSYEPEFKAVYINSGEEDVKPVCQKEIIKCNTDSDCAKCTDNVEIKCVEIDRTSDHSKQYGVGGKYCLPEKPSSGCNAKNGGIWTWTGWSDTERMEWDCLCTYPQIAGGAGCQDLNPNVCAGGTWTYDATTATKAPSVLDCTCPKDFHLLSTEPTGVPLCVPHMDLVCQDEATCETMYSDSKFVG
jgi:hypothetical protein